MSAGFSPCSSACDTLCQHPHHRVLQSSLEGGDGYSVCREAEDKSVPSGAGSRLILSSGLISFPEVGAGTVLLPEILP